MTPAQRAQAAVSALKQAYPQAPCSLQYQTPFQLLVATRLSAQCTDARVNLVTPALFAQYPTPEALAEADPEAVGALIFSCGFYRTKAQELVRMAQRLRDDFGSQVPDDLDQLTSLPGVGRKTANLICGDVFGQPAVVADTHLIRIANLLGLVQSKNPLVVERTLRALLPPTQSSDFCHRCVLHGRAVCIARRPQCAVCCLAACCAACGS